METYSEVYEYIYIFIGNVYGTIDNSCYSELSIVFLIILILFRILRFLV